MLWHRLPAVRRDSLALWPREPSALRRAAQKPCRRLGLRRRVNSCGGTKPPQGQGGAQATSHQARAAAPLRARAKTAEPSRRKPPSSGRRSDITLFFHVARRRERGWRALAQLNPCLLPGPIPSSRRVSSAGGSPAAIEGREVGAAKELPFMAAARRLRAASALTEHWP
jgi:hypothetical protein